MAWLACQFDTVLQPDGTYLHTCRTCGTTRHSSQVDYHRWCRIPPEATVPVRSLRAEPKPLDDTSEAARREAICRRCERWDVRVEGCGQLKACERVELTRAYWRRDDPGGCRLGRWFPAECPACALSSHEDPLKEPRGAAEHIAALDLLSGRRFAPMPTPRDRGIVYCGEGKYWPGIVVGVKLLRQVTDLPIQIWHNGPVGNELAEDDVEVINVAEHRLRHPARVLGGWEVKTYAILHSGFKEVLFIDADAYCVSDPTPLFAELQHAPFVFWNDLHCCEANVHWEQFGLSNTCRSRVPAIQGGHLIIDTVAFQRELMIAHWLNQHSDYFYKHGFGDQDMWRVALAITGQRYKSLGDAAWRRIAFVCEHRGRPMIVHRCRGKLYVDKVIRRYRALPREDEVFRILEQHWTLLPPEAPQSRREGLRQRRQLLLTRR